MKFEIKYTKIGNQFFFISNLTEWHFSCEKEYNKIWLKKTGPLNSKEKEALRQFAKILKKYGFKKKKEGVTWLGLPFVVSSQKRAWQNVKAWVNKEEYERIKRIFDIFAERFEKIWTQENLKLKRVRDCLTQYLLSKKIQKALSDLSNFYKTKLPSERSINIYLFAIPRESSGVGGSAILGEKGIILEVRDSKSINDYALVIIHELTHAFLEKDSIKKNLGLIERSDFPQNKFLKQRDKLGLVSELVLCSLIPDGYLAKKYFNIPIPNPRKLDSRNSRQIWKSLVKFIVFYTYPLAKEYIETKKPLDGEYIIAIIKLVKKFFKNYNK